ncbi:hypothetical protein VTK56DRAFT_7482 [Thermocarpiscus australiensis]
MARLNEPPAPAESHLDILRKKFLRQNRDIAKVNSDQSQKIRRLENDCARLLSENLGLRSQILRLEKQVEDNSARRIADHALEIKAKLEAQLAEFASVIGSLGLEPPSKRHSPDEGRIVRPRQHVAISPAQRKRRETLAEAEALAEQEGRLPPIWENETHPRVTMNTEEIMALCAASADTSDSPDLGPPPVSRFVEEDSVREHSPTRATGSHEPKDHRRSQALSPNLNVQYDRKPPRSPESRQESEDTTTSEVNANNDEVPPSQSAPSPVSQSMRAGAKRKYGEESEPPQIATAHTGKENAIFTEVAKAFPARSNQKRRSIKELPATRRERAGGARTPLAVKSTNQDVSSPRKVMKAAMSEEDKMDQTLGKEGLIMKKEACGRNLPPKIEVPPPEPPAVMTLTLEAESVLPPTSPSAPSTPDRPARKEMPHDTPPPADISSNGETSRPSRRARVPISYAEPNLRDKMRRPTKELFDAVSGEGKFIHRSVASQKSDDHSDPTSVTKVRSEPGSSARSSGKSLASGERTSQPQPRHHLSPLAQKDIFPDILPSTVVMERRKRTSAVGSSSRESLSAVERPESASGETPCLLADPVPVTAQAGSSKHRSGAIPSEKAGGDDRQQQQQEDTTTAAGDVYDFASYSSNASETKEPPDSTSTSSEVKLAANTHSSSSSNDIINTTSSRSRTARKSSMAAAAALRELLDGEEEDEEQGKPKALHSKSRSSSHARKRASMLAPKKTSMIESLEESAAGSDEGAGAGGAAAGGANADGFSARDRISRRRSMML